MTPGGWGFALAHVAWGFARVGNGLAGSWCGHAWGWRERWQIGGCLGGFGAASRCMGVCAASRCGGFFGPAPRAVSSDRSSGRVKSIAVSSCSTEQRSRSAVEALRSSGGPERGVVRHWRMGAARSSTRNPARTMAPMTAPRRLSATIVRPNARMEAVRPPWVVRAAAMRARPSAEGPVLAPPCMRQRPFFIAGARLGQPMRVLAPHRGGGVRVAARVAVAEGGCGLGGRCLGLHGDLGVRHDLGVFITVMVGLDPTIS